MLKKYSLSTISLVKLFKSGNKKSTLDKIGKLWYNNYSEREVVKNESMAIDERIKKSKPRGRGKN